MVKPHSEWTLTDLQRAWPFTRIDPAVMQNILRRHNRKERDEMEDAPW